MLAALVPGNFLTQSASQNSAEDSGGALQDCWSSLPAQLSPLHCALYSKIPQQKGGDSVSPSSLLPLLSSGDHQSPVSFCLPTLWPWNFLAETWDNPRACVICFLFLRDYYPSLSNVQCLENYGFIFCIFFSCFSWKGKSDPWYFILGRSHSDFLTLLILTSEQHNTENFTKKLFCARFWKMTMRTAQHLALRNTEFIVCKTHSSS